MLVEVNENGFSPAVLKVIGLGGAGGNAVNRMLESEIRGVEFLVANTDVQALNASACPNGIQLGAEITGGLGSGGNAEVGRKAAEEDVEMIRQRLQGADMVFITAGMGGGTGTGASPVVAQVARELGALTVGIVTKPFAFEGRRRMRQAEEGLADLREHVDTLIVIPNQRLLHVVDRTTPLNEALRVADDVLSHATKGISEIITVSGLINVDFADVRSVMTGMGNALMGMGFGQGADRAREASQMAIASPLLEDISIAGARGVLVNFMGGPDMTLAEVDEASHQIMEAAGEDANVIFGAVIDPRMKDEIRVTLIATGFGMPVEPTQRRAESEAERLFRDELRASAPPLMPSAAQSVTPLSGAAQQPPTVGPKRTPLAGTDPSIGSPALNQDRAALGDGPRTAAAPLPRGDGHHESAVPRRDSIPGVQVGSHASSYAGAGAGSPVVPGRTSHGRPDDDGSFADGIVGKARPMRRSEHELPVGGAAAFEESCATRDPAAATAPDDVPPNVVPLVWKKNLSGRQWSPVMSSKWQRVLRREQLDVPSFLRRRQVD
jgi:cell division protein FtsZ